MQQTTYTYNNQELNIKINLMPIWFNETHISGNKARGSIILETETIYDDIWGPIGKIEINWEECKLSDYYHPRMVKKSIDTHTSIGVTFLRKKNDWVNSHILTIWHGIRRKLIKTTYYEESSIHGIFHCDISLRVIEISAAIVKDHFIDYERYLLDAFYNIECH
ncbi:MAG: hypothetical protein ACFFAS_16760 [Promethearchaeota archaeon]